MSKDTFYTLKPLNWLLRVTGLSNIYREGNQLVESGSKIKSFLYIISLGLLNIFFANYKVRYFQGNRETGFVRFHDALQVIYFVAYGAYIIDMFYVYKYNRILLLEHFKAFDFVDSILGVPLYDDIRKLIFNCVVIAMTVYVVISTFDFVTWVLLEGWINTILYSIDYFYFFLTMLTILDILTHVIQIEYRLKMIADLLQNGEYLNSTTCIKKNHTVVTSAANQDKNKSLNSLKSLLYTKHLETDWYHRCYLLLLERVAFINRSYGFRVLVYCINLLVNMIYLLNLAMRLINGTLLPTYGNKILILLSCGSALLRALNYGVMATILMYGCEQNYKQSNRILDTLDIILVNKNIEINLKTSLLEFRNLIITRPIKFHAINFFTMDYTLLVSLSSVVVTYTIIMFQSIQ